MISLLQEIQWVEMPYTTQIQDYLCFLGIKDMPGLKVRGSFSILKRELKWHDKW
jgi:hypothetical protein